MLSEKLAKYTMIRDDKFIDDEKNRKKNSSFFFLLTFERPLLFGNQSNSNCNGHGKCTAVSGFSNSSSNICVCDPAYSVTADCSQST